MLSEINCSLTEGMTSAQPPQRSASSASWNSFPIPTTASRYASTSLTSDNEMPASLYPMTEYIPSRMTSKSHYSKQYISQSKLLKHLAQRIRLHRNPTTLSVTGSRLMQMQFPAQQQLQLTTATSSSKCCLQKETSPSSSQAKRAARE